MKKQDVKVGGFYLLRDGTTVFVSRKQGSVCTVWEQGDQEPTEVQARSLVSETTDPNPPRVLPAGNPNAAKRHPLGYWQDASGTWHQWHTVGPLCAGCGLCNARTSAFYDFPALVGVAP